MDCPASHGQVINVGSQEEITILELAQRIKQLAGSTSEIRMVPYAEAYGEGFEDMQRRLPSIEKVHGMIGWKPSRSLDEILHDVIEYVRGQNG